MSAIFFSLGTAFSEIIFYNAEFNSVSDTYSSNPYLEIVESMFGRDASKIVFGKCLVGCKEAYGIYIYIYIYICVCVCVYLFI